MLSSRTHIYTRTQHNFNCVHNRSTRCNERRWKKSKTKTHLNPFDWNRRRQPQKKKAHTLTHTETETSKQNWKKTTNGIVDLIEMMWLKRNSKLWVRLCPLCFRFYFVGFSLRFRFREKFSDWRSEWMESASQPASNSKLPKAYNHFSTHSLTEAFTYFKKIVIIVHMRSIHEFSIQRQLQLQIIFHSFHPIDGEVRRRRWISLSNFVSFRKSQTTRCMAGMARKFEMRFLSEFCSFVPKRQNTQNELLSIMVASRCISFVAASFKLSFSSLSFSLSLFSVPFPSFRFVSFRDHNSA